MCTLYEPPVSIPVETLFTLHQKHKPTLNQGKTPPRGIKETLPSPKHTGLIKINCMIPISVEKINLSILGKCRKFVIHHKYNLLRKHAMR